MLQYHIHKYTHETNINQLSDWLNWVNKKINAFFSQWIFEMENGSLLVDMLIWWYGDTWHTSFFIEFLNGMKLFNKLIQSKYWWSTSLKLRRPESWLMCFISRDFWTGTFFVDWLEWIFARKPFYIFLLFFL